MPKNSSTVARLIEAPTPELELPPASFSASRAPFLAECIDARHPVLSGRVHVRWRAPDGCVERWVPTLRGVAARAGDRVLMLQTGNELEPIVVGVVDGIEPRETQRSPGPSLELALDQVFTLLAQNGQPLVEIFRNAEGPVVRLLSEDTHIELPGKLRIQAADIELSARRGAVRIQADDDVVVQGKMVRLN
jgi:hypothetical protein